jgi:hypothetical protein
VASVPIKATQTCAKKIFLLYFLAARIPTLAVIMQIALFTAMRRGRQGAKGRRREKVRVRRASCVLRRHIAFGQLMVEERWSGRTRGERARSTSLRAKSLDRLSGNGVGPGSERLCMNALPHPQSPPPWPAAATTTTSLPLRSRADPILPPSLTCDTRPPWPIRPPPTASTNTVRFL